MTRITCALVLAVATMFTPNRAAAQGSVTIFGSVTDTSGAVLAGARITATSAQTAFERVAVSDANGNYVISALPVGVYTIKTELAGFKTFQQERVEVQVDENRRVNVVLELGPLAESVTVAGENAQVDTRTGTLREVVDSRRIVELPLNGRNPLQLQLLVAGAGGRAGQGQAQNDSVSINGSRTNSNNYALDGADNHDPYFNTPSVFPSPDALEEFSLQTSSYSADKGRNAGALMNAVTKSGTNQFRGTAFEFLRDEALNARNFFADSVPPFKRHQFGGTGGGPLRHDRTFFFLSYQRTTQESAPGSVTATVLSDAQRGGDFSQSATPLRDPRGGFFPGNIIPPTRLHPASQKFLEAFVPHANRPGGLLTFASEETLTDDQFIVKADHHLSPANQLSGRMLYNFNDRGEATANLPGFLAAIEYSNWSFVANDLHIFSPRFTNALTFSYNDIDRRQLSVVPGNQTWTDFGAGFTRTFTASAPAGMHTQVDGYFNAFSRFPLNHFRKNIQVSDVVTLTLGPHLFKFGGDVRRSILDLQEFFRGDPFVRFRATFTGNAAADFLLGLPTVVEQIAEDSNHPRTTEYALFAQDDFTVSPRLTLNLGLRWDPYLPFIDETDRFSQVRLGEQSKVFPTAPQGVVFAGDPGVPRSIIEKKLWNFGPRLGFAYDPFGTSRTSVRGGYGVFYSQIRQQAHNQISTNQPFSLKLTINNPPGGIDNPYETTGNPFPFVPPQTPEERSTYRFLTPLTMTQWDPNFRNAIVQQWNVNVQQRLFGTYIATVAYVGSRGDHLFMTSELNPAIFGRPGRTLDERRPLFPTFASITNQSSDARSEYHALQLSLNKRLSRGFSILSNYTWSRLLDNASADGDGPPNPFDLNENWGISDLDLEHRFVTSFIWQMPEPAKQPRWIRDLLGGWQTNAIVTLESGSPFGVASGRDNSQSGVNRDRADMIGNPELDPHRPRGELVARYFNTDAFVVNAPGTFGNSRRNLLRGPGFANVDFGLVKNVRLVRTHTVQFRAEFFNLFNHVNLGNPVASVSAPNVGQIISAGSPRVIQLALKYSF
jgi:outer membrane receptor protein involved in Fe transport